MTTIRPPGSVIVVNGDITIDWNLARTRSAPAGASGWNAEDTARAYGQRGGAAMLADLVQALADDLRRDGTLHCDVRQPAVPHADSVCPGDPRFPHSYAMWALFKSRDSDTPAAWRVQDFLGLDRSARDGAPRVSDWKRVVDDTADAKVVVLDDAALGFREEPSCWPLAITAVDSRPWVVVKMASPVANGRLWDHLLAAHAERLIVVTTVRDLRRTEVQISRELSWERTAQDLAWELRMNPAVNGLSRAAHTVVSFDTAGALLLSRHTSQVVPDCVLFFGPRIVEGEWGASLSGRMVGYTTCLTAGIVRQTMLAPDAPDIARGIQSGLSAMRELHVRGYGLGSATAPGAELRFPTEAIARRLASDENCVATARVEDPTGSLATTSPSDAHPQPRLWSILEDRYSGSLELLAERVALRGVEAELEGVPIGRFGKLLSVDRRETESLRSVRALVREYARQGRQKPFSMAVFGPPGAGKSFTVEQITSTVLPHEEVKRLTFNLSQMNGPAELHDALHQVRDVGLSGRMPLVFWDEFDSSLDGHPLGWLRHFLAPMQDGSFQEGQVTHPIGRAIFVFAGGMSDRLRKFMTLLAPKEFAEAKGTDFVSRLKGCISILGPNPSDGDPRGDPYFVIRRAILLRSILEREAPRLVHDKGRVKELSIDRGVLQAFLRTRIYKHGARSMESVITTSLLAGASSYERSCLPAESQLDLHVDALDFLALVQQPELSGELLERLAQAAHEVFCEDMNAKGYTLGAETSEARRTHSSLKPFVELIAEEKDQNRQNVRDIPAKLAAAGYVMIPARGGEPPFAFPGEKLERLAEMEHIRWVRAKLIAGWRHASTTKKELRLHEALLPWRRLSRDELVPDYGPLALEAMGDAELPEWEREKDRTMVRAIPRILAKMGYTVVERDRGSADGEREVRPESSPQDRSSRMAHVSDRPRAGGVAELPDEAGARELGA